MKPKYQVFRTAMAATVTALGAATLHAQTAWDGGGANTDYSNALNWAGDIIPGNGNANGALIGNSSNQTVVYNTATSYTSTGTGKANSLLVGTGTDGVGSLTLSGSAGTLTFGGNGYSNAAWIGSGNAAATGTVTVSAGKLAITGGTDASINLGVHIGGTGIKNGTLLINGGTVEVGRRILMGANATSAVGLLTISSGTLDMRRTGVNTEGDLGMIRFGAGTNTVNLDGGTVIFSGFHTNSTGVTSASSSIFMNGTTLKANAAISDLFNGTTSNSKLILKNGGLVVDTNVFSVTINDALTQEAGHTAILRKEGAGTLTVSSTNAYTGATAVNNGTLLINGNISTSLLTTVASGATLGGSGTVGALTVQDGGTLAPGALIGALSSGAVSLANLSNLNFELTPGNFTIGGGINDLVSVTGNLTLDGILNLAPTSGDFLSAIEGNAWRLFNYSGTLTDNTLNLDSMPSLASGLNWNIDTATSGQVNLVVIPEPSHALLVGIGSLALLRRRRR